MKIATELDIVDVTEAPAAHPVAAPAQRSVASTQSATPADLVRFAMESGADLDRLERLMNMQFQWEEREAKKAYTNAMAEFKKNPPTIFKDKHVSFKTDKGTTSYDHATLGNVVEKVVASLAEHGFSHRWVPNRSEGGMISITCVITHKQGHSEETTLEAGLDQSGGKNNIQAMISTKSYLERHSLLAAVGLATRDTPDDDGRRADRSDDVQAVINEWIGKAKAAKSADELTNVWKPGSKAIRATGDSEGYAEFKSIVEHKGADFRAAGDSK